MSTQVSFSFGDNWERFLGTLRPESIQAMVRYFDDWLPVPLERRRFLDIGSGSGLSSLVAYQRGAEVVSFDRDPQSVRATTTLWRRAGESACWAVQQGSVLDAEFLSHLGMFDVVLAWGVLHHTGHMWQGLDNAASVVADGGFLWIALYHKTRASRRSLQLKRTYNRTPKVFRPLFRGLYAAPKLARMALRRDFTPISGYHRQRGMDWWRDVEDWLGGLPYEVAAPGEVIARLRPIGFVLERLESAQGEGDNDVYLFRREASQ